MSLQEPNKNWRVKFWLYAPIVFWVGMMLFLSSGVGSSDETSRFVRPLLHFLFPSASETDIALYHYYIRKSAHFTEYAIFAVLIARPLLRSSFRDYWPFITVVAVAAVASVDEFYQSFNPARTSSPYDVLLDVSGGVFAILLLLFINYKANTQILSE